MTSKLARDAGSKADAADDRAARVEQLQLMESETVVERGQRKLVWLIRQARAWLPASTCGDAVVEYLEPGPGTVWERRVQLSAPIGTILQRVESRPADPRCRRKDPLDYLGHRSGPPRAVRRKLYRVGRRGKLIAIAD